MKRDFIKTMIMARKGAGLTQEQAAERLNISVRTLAYYEQGKILTEDVVAMMVQVYRNPALGYAYLSSESAVGRLLLPRIRITGVSSGAMQLRVTLRKAEQVYELLEEICCDDEITPEEEGQFSRCVQAIDELISKSIAVKLAPRKTQKKERPAGTGRSLSMNRLCLEPV